MRTGCVRSRVWSAAAVLLVVAGATSGNAQEPGIPLESCDGRTVSEIDVSTEPAPAFIRGLASAVFRYQTTRPSVVRAFLLLDVGDECSDVRRSESARILRRQRFLASARVHAIADTGNAVRLLVATTDELPVVAGGDFSGGLSALTLGTSNYGGRGLLAALSWRDGEAYRTGWGVRVEQTPLLNRPWRARARAEREPLGYTIDLAVGHEFLTNLQRFAWHAGLRDERNYEPFRRRDERFPVAVVADHTFWNAGGVGRIGGRGLGVFGGALLTRERFSRHPTPVIVTDSGLVNTAPDVIGDRYPAFSNTRVAGVVGMRALRFVPAVGVATLAAEQDLPSGVQLGFQFGRSVPWFQATDRDQFVSLDLYAGRGSATRFLMGSGQIEARRDLDAERWDGIIGSGRISWYYKPTLERTWEVTTELSGGWRERLPLQLTLGDGLGGLRGFRGARDGGARRVVARVERRQLQGFMLGERAAWGYAAFADAGKLWSGDVPFGITTSVRGSAGVSLLAAIPAQSRRLMRLDIAVPLTTGSLDDWQVRFLSVNSAGRFWREPGDVFRARSGSSTSNIFQWP